MKPHRLTLVNALMIGYGLDKQIHQIYNPPPASREELLGYHDRDYVDFLSRYVMFLWPQRLAFNSHSSHGTVDLGSLHVTKTT
jgi:acetoin utilization deacetylase AcuC-like enzyme